MEQDNFQKSLLKHTEDFRKVLATPSGDWSIKGFIDIAKNIKLPRIVMEAATLKISVLALKFPN